MTDTEAVEEHWKIHFTENLSIVPEYQQCYIFPLMQLHVMNHYP